MMIRTAIVSFCGSALVSFLILSYRQPSGAYISPGVVHLGTVNPDEQEFVESKFQLVNKTSRELGIVNLISSCVCSSVDTDKRLVAPGDSANISVKIRTGNLRGHRSVPIQVYTDHLQYPKFELVTTCDFTTNGKVSPLDINMPSFVASRPIQWSFQIPLTDVSIEDLKSEDMPSWLQVKPENLKDGLANLVFSGLAPEAAGNYDFSIQVKVQGAAEWTSIAIHSNVVDRYETPSGLNLGLAELGEKLDTKFRVADRLGASFVIARVMVNGNQVSATSNSIDQGVQEVVLNFLPEQTQGPHTSKLTCEIVCPDTTSPMVVSLPLQYRLLPSGEDS